MAFISHPHSWRTAISSRFSPVFFQYSNEFLLLWNKKELFQTLLSIIKENPLLKKFNFAGKLFHRKSLHSTCGGWKNKKRLAAVWCQKKHWTVNGDSMNGGASAALKVSLNENSPKRENHPTQVQVYDKFSRRQLAFLSFSHFPFPPSTWWNLFDNLCFHRKRKSENKSKIESRQALKKKNDAMIRRRAFLCFFSQSVTSSFSLYSNAQRSESGKKGKKGRERKRKSKEEKIFSVHKLVEIN